MRTCIAILLALSCSTLLHAPQVQAASFRCGNHLVLGGGRHGPTQYEVLRKCGEPTERRFSTWIYTRRGTDWELNFSANGILRTVRQIR